MSSNSRTQRSVKTPLDDIKHDAALAANLRPDTAEIVGVSLTLTGELELDLRGEPL